MAKPPPPSAGKDVLRDVLAAEKAANEALEAENRLLRREKNQLQRALEQMKEELDLARRELRSREKMVSHAYDRMHEAGITEPLEFAVGEEGICLFEQLDTTFTMDDLFEACDELQIASTLGARHLEVYLEERMVKASKKDDPTCYYKTGRRPYF